LAILLHKNSKVLVQGITGHGGARGTARMLEYGTNVVAGVTPGRGGEKVMEVPVYRKLWRHMVPLISLGSPFQHHSQKWLFLRLWMEESNIWFCTLKDCLNKTCWR